MPEDAVYETRDTKWYYWQDEAGRFMRSPRVPFDDQLRGDCSGIPECCIKFFIEVWSRNNNPWKDCSEHAEKIKAKQDNGSEFFYIPCPTCLEAESFVSLKNCTEANCFCGQWERKELIKYEYEERKQRRRTRMSRKKRRGYA